MLDMLADRGRVAPGPNGLPEENDGERLDLSLRASDQLKPSPATKSQQRQVEQGGNRK